ncbi:hypothetical protein LCGC14_1535010 [marine sediment metagenome]|uniref:Uncharacterized protein n=1 Tax=marine sediment metagenome TaxID=412755 RepID=A0A0F9JFM5_9ZZZZ
MNQTDLERAALCWDELADEELNRKLIDAKHGSTQGHSARVRIYRRTAESIRLEIKTGRPHCACCLSPEKPYRALS